MKVFKSKQTIRQLEKRKGGYFYLKIDADLVDRYPNKRHTRLICKLDNKLSFQCGLNHLGDGNFFIILSGKNLETISKTLGDTIQFELREDPNPLGVNMPEVLEILLEQEPHLKVKFEDLTLGKRRNLVHQMNKIKDIDKQIKKTIELINNAHKPRPKREL
ncbi:MAG: DUF1905 domain-containing protein [Chitinophagaceae bacterium]|nr:DUF1905 domain-containing protein [Chitinophagaceae bacterium]